MSEPVAADAEGFQRFHRSVLPERITSGNGHLAWTDLQTLGTLGVRTSAGSFTYLPTGEGESGTVEIIEGDETADTVVELDLDSWHGLISDLDTAPGLFYGGRATVPEGNPMRFVRWEPGLRALFHGRPVFDPDTADLREVDGSSLDPMKSFQYADLENDPSVVEAAGHFLTTAGYLVVRNVFSASEVADFLAGCEQAEADATPGDEQSWWGRNTQGEDILTRVLNAGVQSQLAALTDDPRIKLISEVSPEPLHPRESASRDSVTVLWKRKNIAEGLSDLPWHRDCGMGGHAINCPLTVMSICLTSGTPGAGELRALPGSQVGSYPFIDGRDTEAPEGVGLDVSAGDLSLHYSDVMHASMPPTDDVTPERISLLIGFVPEGYGNHASEGVYNDALLANEDGQVEHLADKLGYDKFSADDS